MARHLLPTRRYLRRAARLGVVLTLGAAVVMSVAALPAAAETVHVVTRGESLASIAAGAKLDSWRPIWDANATITNPDLIYPGQRLAVPAKGEKVKHRPLPGGLAAGSISARSPRAASARVRSHRPAAVRTSAVGGTVWDRLAQCESGGNWSTNTGNGYSGGLQFSASTWRANGGSGSAHQASRAEQIRVAQRVQASQGWAAWPACSSRLGIR